MLHRFSGLALALTLCFTSACDGEPSGEEPSVQPSTDSEDPPAPPTEEPPTEEPPAEEPPTEEPPTEEPPTEEPPVEEPPVEEPPAMPPIGATCFSDIFDPSGPPGPDYDQFAPTVGSHCQGTNHQDITGVERVVFIGDSVTIGSPPTQSQDFYRSRLSDQLASHYGLEAPGALWRTANPLTGQATLQSSGDFASCAEWGARTDDLLQDNAQLAECFPQEELGKSTLVVFTIGGNDVASFTKKGAHAPYEETRADVEAFIEHLREAVTWLKDPVRFPNGSHVVFANMFEFTDATGEIDACPAAGAAGFTEEWDHPEWLEEFVIWANEQFMAIAVESGSDMIFMLESFCGHGYKNDDPTGRCYRGPDAERWFDLTCIHPNPRGHEVIADMFFSVITE